MARPRSNSQSRQTAGRRTTINVSVPARRTTTRRATKQPARTLAQVYTPTASDDSIAPYVVGGAVVAGTLAYLLWPRLAGASTTQQLPTRPGPAVLPPPEPVPPRGGIPQVPTPPAPIPPSVPIPPSAGQAEAQRQARELAEIRAESLRKFPQVRDMPVGYQGPGIYRVVASSGLNLRRTPVAPVGDPGLGRLVVGTNVEVVTATTNGWAQISNVIDAQTGASTPEPGYLCLSCTEAPGGPWLVREA